MESLEELPRPWIREKALAGDASCRRYSRVWDGDGRTAILARYPPTVRDQLPRDLEVRAWCATEGLRVPELYEHDRQHHGWMVVEDFGADDAAKHLSGSRPDQRCTLLCRCLGPLDRLALIPPHELPGWNPPLDASRLRWELAGFELWFLRHRLGKAPPPAVGRWLDELAAAIDGHPKRVCHRDYHVNNLFFLSGHEVGLIDYQDVLIGPDTYDAVSLLGERDVPQLVDEADRGSIQQTWADETGALGGWRDRWPLVRMQRALKVLGTFARFSVQGAHGYQAWMEGLARDIGPELSSLNAPSDLVDLLLDLTRRRDLGQREKGA